jgi:hypothetical protein
VKPCCVIPRIGKLEKGGTLDSIINNGTMIEIRKGLLEGNLAGCCARCPESEWIKIEELKKKVSDFLENRSFENTYLSQRREFIDNYYDPIQIKKECDSLKRRCAALTDDIAKINLSKQWKIATALKEARHSHKALLTLPFRLMRICFNSRGKVKAR